MTRDQLLRRIDTAWRDFESARAGLDEAALREPGVTGDWSVKDLVAHVTWWEEEALKHLPDVARGVRPPRYSVTHGGIDAFNALMTERCRALPLAEVLRRHAEVHQRLVDYVRAVPEALIAQETRFRRRLRLDTWGHYPGHARAIRRWREARPEQPAGD